ncbi:MAG: HDIG domain-containing protein [Deltaproteobacteria bacterium]|nr:HDIG domain-containing protein [Deltaproteobacteria bacterium]
MMSAYGMLDNIRAHSFKVEKVASLIAKGLTGAGIDISFAKVSAGALLHDIAKTMCLDSDVDHAVKGKEICIKNGFSEIADIVGEHIYLADYQPCNSVTEQEIIYYSDKRVNHDMIVPLEKRLEYILERYARNKEALVKRIEDNFRICREVEKKIFRYLSFTPEDIMQMVN